MSKIVHSINFPRQFDFGTMRQALRAMQTEMKQVPSLSDAVQALETAIIEMECAETRLRRALRPHGFNYSRPGQFRN